MMEIDLLDFELYGWVDSKRKIKNNERGIIERQFNNFK